MSERSIKNAIIKRADIDTERRVLTFWVDLDYGGVQQSFGGYVLDGEFGCTAIMKLLETVGVERWSQLAGKSVRVDSDYGRVYRLGHFLADKWLDLAELRRSFGPYGDTAESA